MIIYNMQRGELIFNGREEFNILASDLFSLKSVAKFWLIIRGGLAELFGNS